MIHNLEKCIEYNNQLWERIYNVRNVFIMYNLSGEDSLKGFLSICAPLSCKLIAVHLNVRLPFVSAARYNNENKSSKWSVSSLEELWLFLVTLLGHVRSLSGLNSNARSHSTPWRVNFHVHLRVSWVLLFGSLSVCLKVPFCLFSQPLPSDCNVCLSVSCYM